MSILDQNLALRKTIEDYCEARDKAIRDYSSILSAISRVASDLNAISPYIFPSEACPKNSIEAFTRNVDRRMWTVCFDATDLPKYMDAKARRQFDDSLRDSPPEFTFDNVRSSLITAASQADEFFARGLYELFCERPDYYATNRQAFKLPEKVIWSYLVEPCWSGKGLHIRYGSEDKINDLDRVFKTLAGLPFHARELSSAMNDAFKNGNVYQDTLFHIRGFANGNIHVKFLQPKLVDKANKIIADYAGAVIPHDKAA